MNQELVVGQDKDGQHKTNNNNNDLKDDEQHESGVLMGEKRDKSPECRKNDDSPEELYISEANLSTTTTPSGVDSTVDSTTPSESANETPFKSQSNSELVAVTKKSNPSLNRTGDIDDVKQTTEQSNFNANLKSVSMHDMKTKQFNCSVESTTTDSSPADELSVSEASKAASMAFTIDFGDTGPVNTQRHNKMLERFQQRHRRGQSLSKLEEGTPDSAPGATTRSRTPHSAKTPRKKSIGANTSESSFSSEQEDVRVQVRFRDKTTSGVKDSNKRHSWSPRSSMNEPTFRNAQHQQTYYGAAAPPANGLRQTINTLGNAKRFAPRSTTLTKALESVNSGCRSLEISHSGLDSSFDSSLTLSCSDPPLEDIRPPDEDAVSEAGTYTLDGDNYTEEQKEKMNIDNLEALAAKKLEPLKGYKPSRPHNLGLGVTTATTPTTSASADEKRRKNILEVSYSHEAPKAKLSYLDKIKSRVKHIVSDKKSSSKSPDRMIALAAATAVTQTTTTSATSGVLSPDTGTFTSVTTSGVLSVKGTLEAQHPKIKRKNSLTKSQIDSSEYVQGMSKLNLKHLNGDNHGYTDLEKSKLAEYKLNIFTKPSTASDSCEDEVEDGGEEVEQAAASGSVIKTATTKKDWIQEWAKNAREYATKPPMTHGPPLVKSSGAAKKAATAAAAMSRSYDFENIHNNNNNNNDSSNNNQFGYDFDDPMSKSDFYDPNYEEFGDNLDKNYKMNPKISGDRPRKGNHSAMQHQLINRPRLARVGANESKLMTSPTRPHREPSEQDFYVAKPPVSPSKIPSPIHTVGRPRSVSHNRSLCGSNTDLSANDTEMYLNETAAAISSLQNIHRRNSLRRSVQNSPNSNSPCSGLMSPAHKQISPTKSSPIHTHQSPTGHDLHSPSYHRQLLHKRNLSLDGAEMHSKYGHISKPPLTGARSGVSSGVMTNSLNSDSLGGVLLDLKNKMRPYSGKYAKSPITSPMKCYPPYGGDQEKLYVDEAELMHSYSDEDQLVVEIAETTGKSASVGRLAMKQPLATTKVRPAMVVAGNAKLKTATAKIGGGEAKSSPIRRSSSFSTKPATEQAATKQQYSQKPGAKYTTTSSSTNKTPIQKSASSTSFKKMLSNYDNTNYPHKQDHNHHQQRYDDDDDEEYYINDDDDLEPDPDYSTDSDFSDLDKEAGGKPPITNTRYNKAFLMRIEQSKKAVVTGSTNNVGGALTKPGLVACPNTPELRRRDMNARSGVLGMRDRASMPRDSSLNRMKQDISNLNTQRRDKQQLQQQQQQQSTVGGKVLPKYLDISKYKSPSAGNFLKRDESKSTLVHRSPSSASVTLNRSDNARTSVRSVKSAGSKPNSAKKDQSAKIKEQELEMWKRRAKYDPMKAAMEGKKKQEEARRTAQLQQDMLSKSCESSSVLRSQSYHSGVGNHGMYPDGYGNVNLRMSGVNQRDNVNRWTLTSNESSDFDEEYAIT